MTDRDRRKSALASMDKAPPAKWVREMSEHFGRTGKYRAKDIRRVMGDQTESVKVTSESLIAAFATDRP